MNRIACYDFLGLVERTGTDYDPAFAFPYFLLVVPERAGAQKCNGFFVATTKG